MLFSIGDFACPFVSSSFFGVGSLSVSDDTDSMDDWLDVHDDALLSSRIFLGGGPFDLLARLLFFSFDPFESSFCIGVNGDGGVSFSSLDFLKDRLFFGEAFGLCLDDLLPLLSVSDSELLSGENMLFFFNVSFLFI